LLLNFVGQGSPPIKLPLANFTARIVTEVRHDDSVDSTQEFEVEAHLNGQTRRFVVAATQFGSLTRGLARAANEQAIKALLRRSQLAVSVPTWSVPVSGGNE
jgi:hypothetical protein